MRPCARPVRLPKRDLTQAEAERSWSVDRVSLLRCGAEKAEFVRYYDDLIRRVGKR